MDQDGIMIYGTGCNKRINRWQATDGDRAQLNGFQNDGLVNLSNAQSSFSIVTHCHNQLDWLRLCVASVRNQVEEEKTENL